MKLLLATKNHDKVLEIQDKFSDLKGLEILSMKDFDVFPDVVEDGMTFEENALKKAREVASLFKLPVLADDSGLVVDALGGEPGIYSARYAGEGVSNEFRNRYLLEKMKDVDRDKRSARFVCVIAMVIDGREYVEQGICKGSITFEMRGAKGFGYDPVFFISDLDKTMAELTLAEKNRISHRSKALDKARDVLSSYIF